MSIKINNLQTFLANDDQENNIELLNFEAGEGIECQECQTIHTDEELFQSIVCANCGMIIDI